MYRLVGIGLAILAGAGMSVQSRINGELARRIDDAFVAAITSFGLGLILLLCAMPWMRRGLRAVRAAVRDGSLRWWHCVGGVFGALYVVAQGLSVASLGVALFAVAVVAGQSASSLAVDRAGVGPGGPRPITPRRAVGAVMCVVAVAIAAGDRLGDAKALGLAILPLLSGIGIAWQQAVNGRVKQTADSALSAAFVNFLAGTTVLLAILPVALIARGLPNPLPDDLWLYLGGPLGIVFIAIVTAVVVRIGVLVMGMSMIAGQLIGAVAIDVVTPTSAGQPAGWTLLGTALALVAIVVGSRERRRAARF